MNRLFFVSFALIGCFYSQAQAPLTKERAIEIALENSNLLQISKAQRNIALNDATLGNAGFLPTLNATGSLMRASNNQNAVFFNGNTQDRKNAQFMQWNAGISANWVIFNGMRRLNMYQRLRETYDRADAQTKVDIQNAVSRVCSSYYEALRQQEILQAFQNTLEIYQSRLQLAETRVQVGMASKSDVLLTKVDINTQRSLLIRQKNNVENTKLALNNALNQDPNTPLSIPSGSPIPQTDTNVVFSDLAPQLLVTQKSIGIAQRQYKETNAAYLPILSANAGYNYTQQRSEAGQLLSNKSFGPTSGITLSWFLFEGMNKNRLGKNALLQVDISRMLHEENKRNQLLAFQQAHTRYKSALQILHIETESYGMAKESNEIAKLRYQEGRMNIFEYRETQRALEEANIRMANARYDALIAETELKRLNGEVEMLGR
jgi:outer membrane protein